MKYAVIIATYNGAEYISNQLKSILSQSLLPFHIIISDDGSIDETLMLSMQLFKDLSFSSYTIIKGPSSGIIANFSSAMSYAFLNVNVDYYFLSDQDDVWDSSKVFTYIDEMVHIIDKTSPLLFFSDSILINGNGELYNETFFEYQDLTPAVLQDDSILFKNCIQGATVCINKRMLELYVTLNPCSNSILMHDWWLAILAKYCGQTIYVKKPTLLYRQHLSNAIGAKSKKTSLIRAIINPKKHILTYYKTVRQLVYFSKNIEHIESKFSLKFHSGRLNYFSSIFKLQIKHITFFRRIFAYFVLFFCGILLKKKSNFQKKGSCL